MQSLEFHSCIAKLNAQGTNEFSVQVAQVRIHVAVGVFPYNAKYYEDEQTKLNDCYFEKKDWRLCKVEVGDDSSHAYISNPIPLIIQSIN